MTPKQPSFDEHTLPLLDEPGGVVEPEMLLVRPSYPVWTENKSKLIQRYLRYFIFITNHGTYIDGFAGPQEPERHDMWTAKLVLESEPKRLRHFFLCDSDARQIGYLETLKKTEAEGATNSPKRTVDIIQGDFNKTVDIILGSGVITEKEAAFALLDQRTFECDWDTVEKLARHKNRGNKIELLYFLPTKWLHRAISGLRDNESLNRWWGHSSWQNLAHSSSQSIAQAFCDRIRVELGYKYTTPWPIYERSTGGAVMYFLVHATDHPEAPKLMSRAYRNVLSPVEPQEQLKLLLHTEDDADN